MVDKLQVLFEAARQTAAQERAAAAAREKAEQARTTAQFENMAALKQQIHEELGPLLDALKGLPEKDGKRFEVDRKDELPSSSTDAKCIIEVLYRAPPMKKTYPAMPHFESLLSKTKPGFRLEITRKQDGALDIEVLQHSMVTYEEGLPGEYVRARATDFGTAFKAMGEGLGGFAPERLDDIGRALGLKAETALAPQVPLPINRVIKP